ncbi:MAG TPA: diguanylate cyclase [Pyrinomonadaceae bacterium]|jgi:diguanylate cyclase (GGDEF)-like protein/putative nucleotidyltransferase with HDIG domain
MIDMSDYNRAAGAYWGAVVGAGVLACAWGLFGCLSFTGVQGLQFLALASFVILSAALPIRIPNNAASLTLGDAFIFLGAIVLGPPAAVLLGAIDSLLSSLRTTRRATSWLAAPATMSLTTLFSSATFYAVLNFYAGIKRQPVGLTGLTFDELLLPLAVMALVQYVMNGLLVATLLALKRRRSIWKFWRDGYVWTAWTFFAAAVVTALLYRAVMSYGLLYVLLSVPVIAATFATYRIYFERVNEKTREAAELARLHLATVEALATAIDAKDQTTHCHVRRVQLYAAGMGRVLCMTDAEIEALRAGALLHDIGKLAVPDHILNKPGKLTPAEFERMKVHTVVGAQILERINFPYPVVPAVRHHHERWDGKGYPDGLRGDEIPLTARVLAVVDCYDSLREERPFRPGKSRAEASAVLLRDAGTRFDPHVVELFRKYLPKFEAEVAARGLDDHLAVEDAGSRMLVAPGIMRRYEPTDASAPPAYLDQIKNAHREVYALYEIARTFGSSLNIADRAHVLVDKVGHVVPYDTCVVYLFDELKNFAHVTHVAGRHAEVLRDRCVAPGEGVIGFVLANRCPVNGFDPMLDFAEFALPEEEHYRSMVALPLLKDERLLGVIAVYSTAYEPYTDDHVRLLDMVARLAADAFANALTHAEAESNALTDPLTGLPNARALHLRFSEEESRARRTNQAFQVVMLDLDEFKQVNDTFGHQTGDQMLREVARVLQAQLREYDFLARYAGDEFVAIVQELTDEQAADLRERIEQAIGRLSLRVLPDKHARVGISVGAARFGTDGETLSHLLIAADQAMYNVKADHRQQRLPNTDTPATLPISDLTSAAIN